MKILPLTQLIGCLSVILLTSGCATTSTTATESSDTMLVNSGFHRVTASTKRQKALLAQLPANEISKVSRNGNIWYVYPNLAANNALVGTPAQYAAYRQRAGAQHSQTVPLSTLKTPVFTGWGGTTWATQTQATRIPPRPVQ
jgi:hypothetical protein